MNPGVFSHWYTLFFFSLYLYLSLSLCLSLSLSLFLSDSSSLVAVRPPMCVMHVCAIPSRQNIPHTSLVLRDEATGCDIYLVRGRGVTRPPGRCRRLFRVEVGSYCCCGGGFARVCVCVCVFALRA